MELKFYYFNLKSTKNLFFSIKIIIHMITIIRFMVNNSKAIGGILQKKIFLCLLLSPILNQTDMYFVVKNEVCAFTPKISVILADIAEAGTFTATYLLSTSRRPCYCCLISNKDLNNMLLTNIIL